MTIKTQIQQFDLLLEGRITPALSGKYFDAIDPSNGDIIARLADADTVDVEIAVNAARLGFDHGGWPRLSVTERGAFLKKIGKLIREHAKELAELECGATGKTIKHATFIDVPTCAETFEHYGGSFENLLCETINVDAPVLSQIEHEPIGVVAAIIPWNYPLIMTAWKLAPALLAGNTVILKTSQWASASIMYLAKLIASVGLPKGVVNIITSNHEGIGKYLVSHRDVDMISFTGSTKTGEQVMTVSSKGIKRSIMELGGKSANIVFADCDMDAAIGGSLSAIFLNQGQMCTAGSRLLVQEKIYKEFIDNFVKRAKTLKIGPADSFETEFGPLVSLEHRDAILKFIEQGVQEGAKLVCGGKIPDGLNPKGAYLEPTIFMDVRNNMRIAQEEAFGPVLCIIPFSSLEQAVAIANDSKYGLAAMVWSKDILKANTVARRLRCGTVWINTYGVFLNEAPFGGYKQSGYGRELGKDGLYAYTQTKHVLTDQTPGGKSLVTSWF